MNRNMRGFGCECSLCGFLGAERLFQPGVYDGGDKMCRKCHKIIRRERTQRIAWAYSVYWMEPSYKGEPYRYKQNYRDRNKRDRAMRRQKNPRMLERLKMVEE